jgi:hypothetical protein
MWAKMVAAIGADSKVSGTQASLQRSSIKSSSLKTTNYVVGEENAI